MDQKLPVLYQAEWCPHSARVRQRLTELGVDVVMRQVAPDRGGRERLEQATGYQQIPVLVDVDGSIVAEEVEIIAHLDSRFAESEDASEHRTKAIDHDRDDLA